MNVFCCSVEPKRAARNLSYKWHVGKMFVESLQISSAIADEYGVDTPRKKDGEMYGVSHVNHPAIKWAGKCRENFTWLIEHMRELAVILEEQGSSAYTASFWDWEVQAFELADRLPEAGKLELYEQNGAFGEFLPRETFFRNQEIAHRTCEEILKPKYIDWMTRTDKKQACPDWRHNDNIPASFKGLVEKYWQPSVQTPAAALVVDDLLAKLAAKL